MIVENTIRKLEKLAEPECSRFIADNRAAFIEKRDNSIRQRLAAAKARKGEPVLQGHDLAGMERFLPETRHMVTVDILNSDSPVGFPESDTDFSSLTKGYKAAPEPVRSGRNQNQEPCRCHGRETLPGQEATGAGTVKAIKRGSANPNLHCPFSPYLRLVHTP